MPGDGGSDSPLALRTVLATDWWRRAGGSPLVPVLLSMARVWARPLQARGTLRAAAYASNSRQCPSEITSATPSTTLIAVSSSIA